MYAEWADKHGFSKRDAGMVKQKFDLLANENKETGDPNCPAPVRRVKHIARAILGRVQAVSLGNRFESDDDSDGTVDCNGVAPRLGARGNKRVAGATGVPNAYRRNSSDSILVDSISQVAMKFTKISDAFTARNHFNIEEVICEEVKKAVSESMNEIKYLLRIRRS